MDGFGKFMADKMKRLNPRGVPSAMGMLWFTQENYLQFLEIFEDASELPQSFDKWIAIAKNTERDLQQHGQRVIRIEVEPEEFSGWCASRGHVHVGREVRAEFGNWKVHEILQSEENP